MCNNLLQYAHVYAWGRKRGRKVISMRFSYKYQFFKICKTGYTGFLWYLMAKYLAALKIIPTASFKHNDCDAKALERMMERHRHIVVAGWFARFYDDFLEYRDEIVDLFTINKDITEPVRQQMQKDSPAGEQCLRLGVHIRRGDYSTWEDGRYFHSDKVYADHINRFASWHKDKQVHVFLSTNDMGITVRTFQELCPDVTIHLYANSAPADLFMLSECDYLIGPPSTFSLVAAMYRDIPLYRMDTKRSEDMTPEGFRLFDYWFRRII